MAKKKITDTEKRMRALRRRLQSDGGSPGTRAFTPDQLEIIDQRVRQRVRAEVAALAGRLAGPSQRRGGCG